jgi:biotin synthase
MMQKILKKVDNGINITKQDAVALLNTDNHSNEYYQILSKANELSRKEYGDRGYVFVQIGLNSNACSGNCKFCSLSKDLFTAESVVNKSEDEILSEAEKASRQNIDALFLMTTADYDFDKYISISKKVKSLLPKNVKLVGNIGDFDPQKARILKNAGFAAMYHVVRLREGEDTDIPREKRLSTLNAMKEEGLELYYCVEPIGPEHTYEEIADEMIRAREYGVDVMAVMRRVNVNDTDYFPIKQITDLEITKIAAVARMVTRPKASMNIHEPLPMALIAGVNQLYAEIGVNPRDSKVDTEKNRGYTVSQIKDMLTDAGYDRFL